MERKQLRASARQAMGQARPGVVWITLAVVVLSLVVEGLSLYISGEIEAWQTMLTSALNGQLQIVEAQSRGVIGWLLALVLDLMGMILSVGYSLYCLRLARKQSPSLGDVFDAFGVFGRAVVLSLLRSCVVTAGMFVYALPATLLMYLFGDVGALISLPLALFPFFLRFYVYRLADFILLDHPELTCMQCLALSRLAMRGRKGELFRLDLSFLGWIIASICLPVYLWVRPYMATTLALYYDGLMPGFLEQLQNRAAAPAAPTPPPPEYSVPGRTPPAAPEPPADEGQNGASDNADDDAAAGPDDGASP